MGCLLDRALDLGIDFVDSSAAYRFSEELIARHIGHQRVCIRPISSDANLRWRSRTRLQSGKRQLLTHFLVNSGEGFRSRATEDDKAPA